MKIFITGANGFIGSHVVRHALLLGHEVYALRRSKKPAKIDLPMEPLWINGTLESDFKSILDECDTLIHLAAYGVNPIHNLWEDACRWNINATLKLLRQGKDSGIKRFIIAGSCSEYGKSAERFDYVPTEAPLEPVNAYGASKAAASIASMAFARENKIELAILRLFHIYGDGENSDRFWPSLKKAALTGEDFLMTNGDQIRDFTPVDFAAKKFLEFATKKKINKGDPVIYNIGKGKPSSLKDFAKEQWDRFDAKGRLLIGEVPYRNDEIMRYVPFI